MVGGDKKTEASWVYTDDDGEPLNFVSVSPSSPIFFMWQAWRQFGTLPVKGDYSNQPISLMAQIEAIEMVVSTKKILESNNEDWSTLTGDQIAMIQWLSKVENDR